SPPTDGPVAAIARHAVVSVPPAPLPPPPAPQLRLVDARGKPLAGVPFWRDERPFPQHPALPPHDAPRTGADGAVALDGLPDREAELALDWLWFGLDEHVAIACELAELDDGDVVTAPERETVDLRISALPRGFPWRISVYPATGKKDDERHNRIVESMPAQGGRELWIARRMLRRQGDGEAAVRFDLVADRGYVYEFESSVCQVMPARRYYRTPKSASARAREPDARFAIRIFEPDGWTASTIGGRWQFEANGGAAGQPFVKGTGWLARESMRRLRADTFVVVLADGEVFVRPPGQMSATGNMFDFVRSQGRPALRRVEVDAGIMAWPDSDFYWESDRGLCGVSSLDGFLATAEQLIVAVWQGEDGALVVQSNRIDALVGPLLRVASDGRVAREYGNRLEALPMGEFEPIRPTALVRGFAFPRGATRMTVRREFALPGIAASGDSPWIPVCSWELRFVEKFGWRISSPASPDEHRRLPEEMPSFGPVQASARLVIAVEGAAEAEVPQRLLR
ncbi:MAG: hypothetical protein KDE27_05985, partial [Planctomycetes bacterium]|nr:hypothetical protein [Planctomycetota bacterium]